jgi:hypothetical protein
MTSHSLTKPVVMRLAFMLVCTLALAPSMNAQPRLSYMIPDLGTTRFATYVEFIGPHNSKGNFGADRVYLNNPGDAVRVRCLRASDTNTIKIGPCIVSWNGRMVSTHVFVLPTIKPNSDKWQDLAPAFRIPLVVEVNGVISNPDTFYIVQPFAFGDRRSDPERILGEGNLGRRSKRGAMIVDSMVLASNAQYMVSLVDPDGTLAGNQGYLPFILLSKGSVYGGSGTEIHADAEGANGGPGGGGGGGGYANFALGSGERGFDGGNGFTGGGPGGYNNAGIPLAPPNSKRKPGTGSGENLPSDNNNGRGSASLNGNPGGESFVGIYENAGGGTGHPFGASGVGCTDRNTCDPPGGTGGGSGSREGRRGGGGGFGTTGQSETGRQNGGKIHGNEALVPLAGGSGGASGNPEGTGRSSSGGGGGGAISLHGLRMWDFDVFVRGASPSSIDIRGGSGSGGGVIVGMRLDNAGFGFVGAQLGSQVGSGFLEGGRGRARYDAALDPIPGVYVGPLTDTLTASLRDVEFKGHGDRSDLQVYVKPQNGDWVDLATISNYPTGSWRRTLRLPGTDTLYFVAVGQQVPLPRKTDEVHDPDMVFSQSAWNIIRLFGPPIIDAPSDRDLGVYNCAGEEVIDTVDIGNLGESPLEIASAVFTGSPGFRLISPTVFPDTIETNSTKKYIVGYTAPPGQSGPQIAQLVLDNNDTTGGKDPWRITYKIDVRLVQLSYRFRGIQGDTADIGFLCVSSLDSESVTVMNHSPDAVTYQRYVSLDPSLIDVSSTNLPATRDSGQAFNLAFNLTVRRIGPAVVPTLLYVNDCATPDTVWLRFVGIDPRLTLVGSGQFGTVPIGASRQIQMELRNDGTSKLDIATIPAVAPPFRLVSAVPSPPTSLNPGESMILTYEFAPTIPGPATASFRIRTTDTVSFFGNCPDSVDVILAGIGANVSIVADPGSLMFDPTPSCSSDTLTVRLRNEGGVSVILRYPAVVNGPDAADYLVIKQPDADTLIPPTGFAEYTVQFKPIAGATATRNAMLTVLTDQPAQPQVDVPLIGTRTTIELDGPRVVNLGLIPVGSPSTRTVTYTNTSLVPISITRITSTSPVTTATPQSFTVSPTAGQNVDITVTPQVEASRSDTLFFVSSDPCVDSFQVVVIWTSEAVEVGIQNIIPFGELSNCEFKVDSVVISNTSSFPIDLIDVVITGPDAALFTILNPAAATGVTLDPFETAVVRVRFDPRGSTDGLKSAELATRIRINNQPRTFITQLSGTRRTTIPSTPSEVRFGNVDILTSNDQNVTIVNFGTDAINITEVRMVGTSGGVMTVTAPPLPVLLQPGARLDIVVTFAPADPRPYVDTVLVVFDQPCADQRPIPVSGTGRLNVELMVVLPEVVIDPADDNVVLPVNAYVATGFSGEVQADLFLTLSFDSPLFVARSVSLGTILRNEVVAGRTELDVDLKNITLTTQESLIFEITGQGTIGPKDSTDLVVADATAFAQGTSPKVRSDNGWIVLTICEEGGPRLITRAGSLSIQPTPSPASEELHVHVQTFERGDHVLSMVDITGQVVHSIAWQAPSGGQQRTIEIDARPIASGTYQLRLLTPTRQRAATIVISH